MLVDLHEDISSYFLSAGVTTNIEPFDVDQPGRHVDIPKYKRANVKLVLGSIFPMLSNLNTRMIKALGDMYKEWAPPSVPISPKELALEQIKIYYSLEEQYPSDLKLISNLDDLDQLGERTGIILHIEGCEAFNEPEDLVLFYRLGVRSIGITWNYDNKYGSSCMSRKDYGLTGEGEELVRIANKLGVMIDLSHAGRKVCEEIVNISESPPFFSHANALSIKKHPRNVDDQLIKKIGERKGIIGITFIKSCIGEPANSEMLAIHAKHILDLAGEDTPAIGTDYLGIREPPMDLKDITKIDALERTLKAKISKEAVDRIYHLNSMNYIRGFAERW